MESNIPHWLSFFAVLYLSLNTIIWLTFRYFIRNSSYTITYGGIELLSSDVSIRSLRIKKDQIEKFRCNLTNNELVIDKISIKWHKLVGYIFYRKPIRIFISHIDFTSTIQSHSTTKYEPVRTNDSPSSNTLDEFVNKLQKHFSCIVVEKFTSKIIHQNLDYSNNTEMDHITAIDIYQSRAIFSDAEKMQNSVCTSKRIELVTSMSNGARILRIEFPFIFKFELQSDISLSKVDLGISYFNLEVEIKLFGIIASFLNSSAPHVPHFSAPPNADPEQGQRKLIYSQAFAHKLINFRVLPIINVVISRINCELYADAESKTFELKLDSIKINKNIKDIEIVEMGRRHRGQNLFKPQWTLESMGAVVRTNLEITFQKCELKTDELEKPVFQATYLKGKFEIDNRRQLPLCIAIHLQSNHLVSIFDFSEFSTWLKLIQASVNQFYVGPDPTPFQIFSPKIQSSTTTDYSIKSRHKKSKSEPPIKFSYTMKPCIEFCLETKIYGCQVQFHSRDSSIILSFNSVTLAHHKQTDTEGIMVNIEGGEIFTELVFTEFERSLHLEPRKHTWGRLIGLQQARASVIKRHPVENASGNMNMYKNTEVKVSGLSGELSKEITDHLTSLFKSLNPLLHFIKEKSVQKNDIYTAKEEYINYADVKIQEVNLFLRCSKCPEMTQFRLDDLSIDRKHKMAKAVFGGIAIGKTQFIGTRIACQPASKLDEKFVYISAMTIDVETGEKSVAIKCTDGPLLLNWSPNYHILVHESVDEILSNIQNISPATTPIIPTQTSHSGALKQESLISLLSFNCSGVTLNLFLNKHKQIKCVFENARHEWCKSNWKTNIGSVKIYFDQHDRSDEKPLIDIGGQTIEYKHSDEENDAYRQDLSSNSNEPTLTTKSNRVLCFMFDHLIFYFPFNYDYYPTHDQAIASFKMVKNLYKPHSEPFSPKARFPADLRFMAKICKVLIQDDPFELKLAAVIRHKKEEWKEQNHRYDILQQRIVEFEANNQKVNIEELELRLQHMNTSQYIKQVQTKKKENRWYHYKVLFSWELENVDLLVLADHSMYGYEKVARTMLGIDPALVDQNINPWDYTTMWARYIRLRVVNWSVQVRDYPRQVVKAHKIIWSGILCGAEQRGNDDINFRANVINPGTYFDDILVLRNLAALKFYHDIAMEYELLDITWGPCFESAWSEVQQAFRLIESPPTDKSPHLPWWDKQRMKYRGRVAAKMENFYFHHLASKDPYMDSERLQWSWTPIENNKSGLFLYWTHGNILFRGDLIIYINTKRKVGNITFLELPNIKMDWKITWHSGSNKTGHNIFPHPHLEFVDSYKNFRSQSLDLDLIIDVRHQTGIKIFLFSTSLRWLDTFWKSITDVSRPIKRGNGNWCDQRQGKKKLSRHYRQTSFQWSFANAVFTFCQGFNKQLGFLINLGKGTFETRHLLSIVQHEGQVLRRSRAEWSIENLELRANQTHFYLKDEAVDKKFFASLDVFKYDRFAELLASGESKRKNVLQAQVFRSLWDVTNRDIILSLYNAAECATIMRHNLSANLTKLFRKQSRLPRESENIQEESTSEASMNSKHDMNSLMDKLLRGEETEFGEQTEEAIEEKPIYTEWDINLQNCQVLLKSTSNSGMMILTAAESNWVRNEYTRTWRDEQYLDKFSWKGQLKGMQLFSRKNNSTENIWVPESQANNLQIDMLHLPDENEKIVDSCSVSVNYVGYSPIPANTEIPANRVEDAVTEQREQTINTLTLNQNKLEIFTKPSQYILALDLVSNLFLHVEPGMKERWERQLRRRFQLQLSEDQTVDLKVKQLQSRLEAKVIELQKEIRKELENVRKQESTLYHVMAELDSLPDRGNVKLKTRHEATIEDYSQDLNERRKYLNNRSEEMAVSLQLAKETYIKHQLLQEQPCNEPHSTRRTHLSFHEIQWNLNDDDGRIANFVLKDFEYLSVSSVDSVLHEQSNQQHVIHEFKIRDFELQNLLPDQIYTVVLQPEDRPTENTFHNYSALRVLCKVKPPVNGLRIKEHIELNMKPMNLQMTNKFYKKIREFFFPDMSNTQRHLRINTHGQTVSLSGAMMKSTEDNGSDTRSMTSNRSTFFQKMRKAPSQSHPTVVVDDSKDTSRWNADLERIDDLNIMAERARANHSFVYIKVPQVPLTISYKTGKVNRKHIKFDIPNIEKFRLDIPLLEYKNLLLTWQDLALRIKTDCKKALFSQALKKRVIRRKNKTKLAPTEGEVNVGEGTIDNIEDKDIKQKRLLFPAKTKKGLFARLRK